MYSKKRLVLAIFCIVLFIAMIVTAKVVCAATEDDWARRARDTFESEFGEYLQSLVDVYDIEYELMLALIWTESTYQQTLIAGRNWGFTQINTINHSWLRIDYGLDNMLCSYQNLHAGAIILRMALDAADNNYHRALMNYNMGHSGAAAQFRKGIYTSSYSRVVVARYELLKEQKNNTYIEDTILIDFEPISTNHIEPD